MGLQPARILLPGNQQERVVRVVLREPAGAGAGIVHHEGAPLPVGAVVARAVEHAPGEEDAAAAPEGHCHLGTCPRVVYFHIDLTLRRVDRGLVRVDRLVLAAGNDVEAAVFGVRVVEGDPDRKEGFRIGLEIVGVLVVGLADAEAAGLVEKHGLNALHIRADQFLEHGHDARMAGGLAEDGIGLIHMMADLHWVLISGSP
jgi:hypothetical protein